MNLSKFLALHAVELAGVASVLETVVRALPIDRQDKARLGDAVEKLGESAKSIAASVIAERVKTPSPNPPKLETRTVAPPAKTPAKRAPRKPKIAPKPAENSAS